MARGDAQAASERMLALYRRMLLVRRAEDYKWSSAAAHCGLRDDPLVESRPRSTLFHGIADWSRWLAEGVAHEEVRALRERARRNLPCGSDEFVAGLEAVMYTASASVATTPPSATARHDQRGQPPIPQTPTRAGVPSASTAARTTPRAVP